MKLNIGCGSNKIEGYVNIDTEESCVPDLKHNILEAPLPYEDGTIEEILFFHCIEHINKCYHQHILKEFYRVLAPNAQLYISYPNFWECAQRWKQNTGGQRSFWEATLYGRQLYETDYHVCAMDPGELSDLLLHLGFCSIRSMPESAETYNSITWCMKGKNSAVHYETLIARDIENTVITEA